MRTWIKKRYNIWKLERKSRRMIDDYAQEVNSVDHNTLKASLILSDYTKTKHEIYKLKKEL